VLRAAVAAYRSGVEQREVVIAGASFAGLACAAAIGPERDVLVLDRRPVGEGETSACALPVSTVRRLGLEQAILATHDDVWVWVAERRHRFPLPEPYCTIDYRRFCLDLAARCGAELRIEGVAARDGGALVLAGGDRVGARFLVDAAGWRRLLGRGGPLDSGAGGLTSGAEEHVEYPDALAVEGLHIYVRHDLAERGYGWNFPSGDHARAGVCSYQRAPLAGGMRALRERDGLGAARARQGGMIPHRLLPAVEDGVLFVGDAAGQCLPLTAEGIRTAIAFATAAGGLIEQALAGGIADDDARRRYADLVARHERHYRALLRYQRALPALPPPVLRAVTRVLEASGIGTAFTRRYVRRIQIGSL
jgi:flavin-dependent dehydrogenase